MTLNSWKRLVAAVLDDASLASQGGVRRLYLGGRLGGCVCSGLVGLLGQAVLGGRLLVLHPPPNPACLPLLSLPFTHSVPCCPGGIWLVLPSILFLADILLFREKRKKGTWLSRSPELFSQPPPQEASVISIRSLRFSELWQVG